MSEKYYYGHDGGFCLETCKVRKEETGKFFIKIGSAACRDCENNLEKRSGEDYILCSRIEEATGKTPVK